jgi:hypothetical protein
LEQGGIKKKKKKRLAKTTRRLNYKKKKKEATTAQQKGEEPQGQDWHAHARRPGRCVVVRDEGSFANHVTTNATRVFVEKVFVQHAMDLTSMMLNHSTQRRRKCCLHLAV